MKILFESAKKIKYKRGMRIAPDNGDVIYIHSTNGHYEITGFDKDNNLFKPRKYASLQGVKNYILKTYDIELI